MKYSEFIEQKVITLPQLLAKRAFWDFKALKVVFTNGCFDILHRGHLHTLAEARDLGDILVVGVNSDTSVRRLKGSERPVNSEQERTLLIAALEPVDAVIVFEEDTPLELIKTLKPQVLVKGGDWKESQIVGADEVKQSGGEIISVPYLEGFSTTAIIEKSRT